MADKDLTGMVRALQPVLEVCYLADFAGSRGLPAATAVKHCQQAAPTLEVRLETSVTAAYRKALAEWRAGTAILVTGSFVTVAEVRPLTRPRPALRAPGNDDGPQAAPPTRPPLTPAQPQQQPPPRTST